MTYIAFTLGNLATAATAVNFAYLALETFRYRTRIKTEVGKIQERCKGMEYLRILLDKRKTRKIKEERETLKWEDVHSELKDLRRLKNAVNFRIRNRIKYGIYKIIFSRSFDKIAAVILAALSLSILVIITLESLLMVEHCEEVTVWIKRMLELEAPDLPDVCILSRELVWYMSFILVTAIVLPALGVLFGNLAVGAAKEEADDWYHFNLRMNHQDGRKTAEEAEFAP